MFTDDFEGEKRESGSLEPPIYHLRWLEAFGLDDDSSEST